MNNIEIPMLLQMKYCIQHFKMMLILLKFSTDMHFSLNRIFIYFQFMFETLNVKGLYVADAEVLAIASSGRSTGLCLSVGEGTSSVLPLHKGKWHVGLILLCYIIF